MEQSTYVSFQVDHDAISFPSLRRRVFQTLHAAATSAADETGIGVSNPFLNYLLLCHGLGFEFETSRDRWYVRARLDVTTPARRVACTVSALATRESLAVTCQLEYGGRRVPRRASVPDYGVPDVVCQLIDLCEHWRCGASLVSTRPSPFRGRGGAARLQQLIDHPNRSLPVVLTVPSELGRFGLAWSANLAAHLAGQATVARLDSAARAAFETHASSRFGGRIGPVALVLPQTPSAPATDTTPSPLIVPVSGGVAARRTVTSGQLQAMTSTLHALVSGRVGTSSCVHPELAAMNAARAELNRVDSEPIADVIPIGRRRSSGVSASEVQR